MENVWTLINDNDCSLIVTNVTILMYDINNRETGCEVWEPSELSSEFSYKPKTVLKTYTHI